MQIVTVTFDSVFDIHQRLTGRPARRVTDFSFETKGAKHYGVSVPGWPEIKEHQTIVAILYEDGNWQTLAGWVNQNTGETTGPNLGGTIYGLVVSLCLSALFAIQAYHSAAPAKIMWAVGAIAIGLFGVGLGRQLLRQREILATLSTLKRA